MKECCKTGSEKEQEPRSLKTWFNYVLYAIIAAILIGTLVMQLIGQ